MYVSKILTSLRITKIALSSFKLSTQVFQKKTLVGLKFCCMLGLFEIRLIQSRTLNFEILHLLVIHRVLWNENSVKSGNASSAIWLDKLSASNLGTAHSLDDSQAFISSRSLYKKHYNLDSIIFYWVAAFLHLFWQNLWIEKLTGNLKEHA